MKKYKYKAKDYRRRVRKYFKRLSDIETLFFKAVSNLEREMAHDTGIKDIEFFWVDGGIVGIGNASRTMELIKRTGL